MPGLDKIIARLNADTEAKCAEIAAEAEGSAAALLSAANDEVNAVIRAAAAEAEKQAEGIRARAKSAAALDRRRAYLSARLALTDGALEEAKARFVNAPAEEYFDTLLQLLKKNAPETGGALCFGKRDLARLPADLTSRLPQGVTLRPDPADIENGFLLLCGDIEINCTADALFAAAKEALRAAAAKELFG